MLFPELQDNKHNRSNNSRQLHVYMLINAQSPKGYSLDETVIKIVFSSFFVSVMAPLRPNQNNKI